jgi:hypothetical protein
LLPDSGDIGILILFKIYNISSIPNFKENKTGFYLEEYSAQIIKTRPITPVTNSGI